MKKLLTMTILVLCLSVQALQAKTLTFATEATYPPFVSMNADSNNLVGFGPELVQAVCQEMKVQCNLVNAPWDSLIPSLAMGKYDALFGGMAITKAREKVVDFSLPYYQNSITFVVNKKSPLTVSEASLKGKTIGVQGGTTFQQYLQVKYGKAVKLKTYASNMTALLDLKSGRVDAVFVDKPVAALWVKKEANKDYKMVGNIYDEKMFGPGNAIAINKNNAALKQALDKAIVALQKSGKLKQLQEKWFGKA